MPNSGKGGKNYKKRAKKTDGIGKRMLLFKEDEQEYGRVTAMLGNCRVEILGADGKTYTGTIRGSMRGNRCRINRSDIVLISLRTFENEKKEKLKCDIIHKYLDYEVKDLIKLEELTHEYVYEGKENNEEEEENTIGFEFTNEEENKNEIMNDEDIDNI